jgi:hypothetical protein
MLVLTKLEATTSPKTAVEAQMEDVIPETH